MKSMDGKAQRTTVMSSLCEAEPVVPWRPKSKLRPPGAAPQMGLA